MANSNYMIGISPPFKKVWRNPEAVFRVAKNFQKANAVAYDRIKRSVPDSKVGVANALLWAEPHNPDSVADRIAAKTIVWAADDFYLSQISQDCDFIGVDYYFGFRVKATPGVPASESNKVLGKALNVSVIKPREMSSDMNWAIAPEFLPKLLHHLKDRYNKPALITENGIADHADKNRAFYILSHLIALSQAMQKGANVLGYYYWSSVDNFEWTDGNKYKFGLIEVDPVTGKRKVRESAKMYGEVAKSGQINIADLAARYLPADQQSELSKVLSNLQADFFKDNL